MNESDGSQDQLDVQNLYLQAIDAYADGRYGDVENKLNGIIKPPQLEVLLQQVKEYYWLATAQRMQGKYNEAIGTYKKLIELVSNTAYKAILEVDNPSLFYIAEAFIYVIECGRILGRDVNALLKRVAEGLNWLEEVKGPNWSAGFCLQEGLLLKSQGKLEEARQKLQDALDFARKYTDSPGDTLATYQLELADLLCAMGFHASAIPLVEEVLATPESTPNDQQRAYKILVYAQLEKGVMTAVHSPTLKDRPLDAAIKSTGVVDNQVLKELQSIKEQLAQLTTTLYPFFSASPASNQQSTAQATQSEKATNLSTITGG
jgi:tetratricopeptide (TPR) repeat protein